MERTIRVALFMFAWCFLACTSVAAGSQRRKPVLVIAHAVTTASHPPPTHPPTMPQSHATARPLRRSTVPRVTKMDGRSTTDGEAANSNARVAFIALTLVVVGVLVMLAALAVYVPVVVKRMRSRGSVYGPLHTVPHGVQHYRRMYI